MKRESAGEREQQRGEGEREENDEEKSEGVSPSDEQVPLVEPEGHIVASSTETNTLVQVTCPHCSQVMTAQKTGSTLSRLFV